MLIFKRNTVIRYTSVQSDGEFCLLLSFQWNLNQGCALSLSNSCCIGAACFGSSTRDKRDELRNLHKTCLSCSIRKMYAEYGESYNYEPCMHALPDLAVCGCILTCGSIFYRHSTTCQLLMLQRCSLSKKKMGLNLCLIFSVTELERLLKKEEKFLINIYMYIVSMLK